MLAHPLQPKLKTLKLSGMAETLDQRAQTAQRESMAPLEFLALLLDDELDRREQNRFCRRINADFRGGDYPLNRISAG